MQGTPLDAGQPVAAASGARVIAADRVTAGSASVLAGLPRLSAFARVAVDVSTTDGPASSEAGVLVTRAGPGSVPSVVEPAIGLMVDLARGVSTVAARCRAGTAEAR